VKNNLRELCTKNIVCEIDDLKDAFVFCEAYVLEKQKRVQFSLSNNKSQEVLDSM
jgi:hypothetical protein